MDTSVGCAQVSTPNLLDATKTLSDKLTVQHPNSSNLSNLSNTIVTAASGRRAKRARIAKVSKPKRVLPLPFSSGIFAKPLPAGKLEKTENARSGVKPQGNKRKAEEMPPLTTPGQMSKRHKEQKRFTLKVPANPINRQPQDLGPDAVAEMPWYERAFREWLKKEDAPPIIVEEPDVKLDEPGDIPIPLPQHSIFPDKAEYEFLGSKEWQALTPRQAVVGFEWWKANWDMADYDPESGCEFYVLDEQSPWWTHIQFHQKKYTDRWAAVMRYIKGIYKNQQKLAAIRRDFKDKIIVHMEGARISLAHCYIAVARGCDSLQAAIDYLKWWFEPEMQSYMRRARAQIPHKDVIYKEYRQAVEKAKVVVTAELGNVAEILQLPELLQKEYMRIRPEVQGRAGYIRQPKRSKTEPIVNQEIIETPEAHLEEALKCSNPFQDLLPVDEDLLESAFLSILDVPIVRKERKRRYRITRRICELVLPFYDRLRKSRPISAERVGPHHNPVFMTVMAEFLSYPDTDVGWLTYWGAALIGHIESSGVMRDAEIVDKEMPDIREDADKWVRKMTRMCTGQEVEEGEITLTKKTYTELDRGESSGPYSYEEMCDIFPKDTFRCMVRFITWSAGKYREIDSGRASLHNEATTVEDKIICSSIDAVDGIVLLQKEFWKLVENKPGVKRRSHFRPTGGCEDLKRAYRQVPVRPEDLQYSVSVFPMFGKAKFIILYALCFGLVSAVIAFNRIAMFLRTMLRVVTKIVVDHYYDDFVTLEQQGTALMAKEILSKIVHLFGWIIDPNKRTGPSATFRWLGAMKKLNQHLIVTEMDKSRLSGMYDIIDLALENNDLSPASAATLRGKFGFAACGLFGNCGRISLAALKNRQYYTGSDFSISPQLRSALNWILRTIALAPSAEYYLDGRTRKHIIIYTDASSEESRAKTQIYKDFLKLRGIHKGREVQLGWVAFDPVTKSKLDMAWHTVEDETLVHWAKSQPIAIAEALAVICALVSVIDKKRNIDVTVYVDNTPAIGALTKGYSKEKSMDELAHFIQLYAAARRCRIWYEYVKSALNPADEPSRGGTLFGESVPKRPLPKEVVNGLPQEEMLLTDLTRRFR